MNTLIPSVAVVTVNFNHGSYLLPYIRSLLQSSFQISEILIVDNNSTDDSINILQRFPNIRIIKNNENIGYSAALNQGIESSQHPLVCITGPDVVLDQDWLEPLVELYKKDPNNIFAVSSRVLTLGKKEIQSEGGNLHFTGHLTINRMWQPIKSFEQKDLSAIEIGAIDSTSALIDRRKFLEIGGCDSSFFIYHEEFDYCYRARMKGWQCWFEPNSVIYHGKGTSAFSVRSRGKYPSLRPYYHTKNRLICIFKNYQLRTIIGVFPILFPIEVLNYLLLLRIGLQDSYINALKWIWSHRYDILNKREDIQSSRQLDDKYLLSSYPITISPIIINNPVISILKYLLDKFLFIYWWALKHLLY